MSKQEIVPGMAARIIEQRKRAGLSQIEFAKLVGSSQKHISTVERQKCGISVSLLMRIAQALRVSEHWLIHGD